MKLIAVSRVKNEIDIIEAFVRHHAGYFDKLIILDDGSTDGTLDVLKSLRAAGLPLVLLREPAVGYEQSDYMTKLLRMAVSQFGADWVAPLDADEFLELQGGMTLVEILARQELSLLTLPWSNFVWKPEYKESLELNPALRMRFRLPPRPDMMKVLVPAHLVDEDIRLQQGNHGLVSDEKVLPAHPLTSLGICHFPIRNLFQYASKVVVGYLQYSAMPDWDRRLGFQLIEPFHTLLADGLDGLERRMSMDSLHYSEMSQSSNVPEPTEAPLRYNAGPLTFTSPLQNNFFCNILRHAETVAHERARILNRNKAAVRETERLKGALTDVTRELERSTEDKGVLETRVTKLQLEIAREAERSLAAVHETELLKSSLTTVTRELERSTEDKGVLETRVAKLQLEIAQDVEHSLELELDLSCSLREHAAMLTISQQLAEDKAAVERRLAKLEIELLATREVNFVQSERLSSRSYKLLELVYRRLTALGIPPRLVSSWVFWLLRIK
jgi:glycosyl transferase family 2